MEEFELLDYRVINMKMILPHLYNITAYVAQFSDCNNRNNDSKYISNDKWNKSRTKCTSSQCTISWTFFLVVAVNKFEY